jgi:integrase/recombinase XerD
MSKNTFNAYLVLDKRRTKSDGTYPIKMRIVINRRSFHIALGHSVDERYWNEKKEQISTHAKTVGNVNRLNNKLLNEKKLIRDRLLELDESQGLETLSLAEIKSQLTGDGEAGTHLLEFFNTVITEEEIKKRIGNARVYKMVRDSITSFLKGEDIPMVKVNVDWLIEYETWYLSRFHSKKSNEKNSVNGLSVNLRTLRALLNNAIKREILSSESYPFKKYSIKNQKTKKRAVKLNVLEALKEYQPVSPNQQKAKDYFFISYYLMGISFVDLAFLQVKNIVDGRVEYERKKGGRLYSIKITPPLQTLLDKFLPGKKDEDFILNVIKEQVGRHLYNNVSFKNGVIEYFTEGDDQPRRFKVSDTMKVQIMEKREDKERQEFLLNLVFIQELKKQYKNVRDELKRYNDNMKVIGQACGVKHKITSYVSRHSFATIAKFKGVPVPIISQALGHESLDTTETYLAEFDDDVMDKYNEMIIGE